MDIAESQKYHTSRRERVVSVTIEKSKTPMVWLDTSVLLDFAKIELGEKIEPLRARRLTRLRTVLRKAVRDERLVCPAWDQDNEFEAKRLEADTRRIISDLSCGAHCIPFAGVKDAQIANGMRAYITASDTIHIPASIHFYQDPLEAVREAKRTRFIVESELAKPKDWIDKAEQDKLETQETVEELRQGYTAIHQTFEKQLQLERIGESDSMMKMMGEYMRLTRLGQVTFWDHMNVDGILTHLSMWSTFGGPGGDLPSDLAALYSFMRSPYFWELPIQDVACRLSADLIVKNSPVKSGDHADVQHLAAAVPVAQFVVADKAMVDRCERLGIGTKWKTKLYSTRTLDDLSDEIAAQA
jgi:hypothetical protein